MKTSGVLFAVVCALAINFNYASDADKAAAMEKCAKGLGEKMTKLMAEIMQAVQNGEVDSIKKKMCPTMKDFTKCILKEGFKERPNDAELNDLDKTIKEQQKSSGQQGIDCGINVKDVADDVWNAAGVAHPLSLLAVAVTALGALFISRGL